LRSLLSFPTRRSSDLNRLFLSLFFPHNCIIDSLSQSFLVELLPYLMQLLFDSLKFLAINFSVACICSLCQLIEVITNRSQLLCYLNRPRFINLGDRKSTRLNSSHVSISYAVFCL